MTGLDPRTTALVLIDLQRGILANPLAPHAPADVVARSRMLADRLRAAGGTIVWVTVDWAKGFVDAPAQPTDIAAARSPDGPPADFAELVPETGVQPGDLRIVKRQWGSFYGTELDLQLRRRGIDTIVIAGVATNLGVESTARDGWERGYAMIFAEDATSTFSEPMHRFAFDTIFPRLGRVVSCDAIAQAFPA